MKSIDFRSRRKYIIAGIGLVLIVIVGSWAWSSFLRNEFLKNHRPWGILSEDTDISARNKELMDDAIAGRNAALCDQITGAINFLNPNSIKHANGLQGGVSAVTPAMSESEAKENCHSKVQSLIDQVKYERNVCKDGDISHYSFNHVMWPCPSD